MNIMGYITKNTILSFLFLLPVLLVACVDDDNSGGKGGATETDARVKMILQMPSSSSPQTYSISKIDENQVETIDVLAFKPVPVTMLHPSGWSYAYSAPGTSITENPDINLYGREKQFTVTLKKDNSQNQKLVILANVRDQLEGLGDIAIGADKDALLARLEYSNASPWNANNDLPEDDSNKDFTLFPMWGEATAIINDALPEITGVQMLRGIARIDVVLADAVTNFTLNEVHIFNPKTKGRIVPDPNNMDENSSLAKVKAATLPPGNLNLPEVQGLEYPHLEYPVPAGMERVFERTMYLFEAQGAAPGKRLEATCIVVGGTYDQDTSPSFYRVDFFKKDGNGANTNEYRDILRNHCYRVNITKVSGTGHPTPEDAFKYDPIRMEVDVTDWDEGAMGNVTFDGQYLLSVTPGEFSFSKEAISTARAQNRLTVYTDHPDGWSIEKIVDALDSPVDWVSVKDVTTGANVTNGSSGEKANLWLDVEENTGNQRMAQIHIAAGRMRYIVLVVQKNTLPDASLSIIDPATGKEITELLFASTNDVVPASHQFTVNWLPASAGVTVTTSPQGSNPDFEFHTGSDVVSTGTIPGGTGSKTYTIQPPVINNVSNPFVERITKAEYTVSDGVKSATRSIYLRQLVYHLKATTESFYLMDGGEHSFTVKSNYPWKAEIIETGSEPGKDVVTGLITNYGDANTTTGVQVRFMTTNDLSNQQIYQGTARIKFTNLYDESITETVDLNCINAIVMGESNCYMVKPGGYKILIPVSRANADGTTRIGVNDILTPELLWTDHPGGVKATSNKPTSAIDRIGTFGTGDKRYISVYPGVAEGNSVIAVKVNGGIKWSWHIWTTAFTSDLYDYKYEPLATPQKTKLYNNYTFLDRHIGALTGFTTNTNSDYGKTGLFYQWGRKDPFPSSNSTTEPGLYDMSGVRSTSRISKKVAGGTLALSIANPATIYNNNWNTNNEMWGNTGGKTVYDPCPPGWRVPAWRGTVSPWVGLAGSGNYNKGHTWGSVGYYPASGWRNQNGALSSQVGTAGFSWSAKGNNTTANYLSFFSSTDVRPSDSNQKAFSFPVRCVKE